jgi:hypothetical protein
MMDMRSNLDMAVIKENNTRVKRYLSDISGLGE